MHFWLVVGFVVFSLSDQLSNLSFALFFKFYSCSILMFPRIKWHAISASKRFIFTKPFNKLREPELSWMLCVPTTWYLFVVIYESIFLLLEFKSSLEAIIVYLSEINNLITNHEISLFVGSHEIVLIKLICIKGLV